jgi:transposase InsO family protein
VEIDYLWQIDLIDVTKYAHLNKGFHFLLTCIDVCSRFAFVIPVKRKSGKAVTEGFRELITSSGRKCKFLQGDEGLEFFNSEFRSYIKTLGIVLYHNHSPLKAAMVERFNRTLMMRLQKVFTDRGKTMYHDVLQDIVFSYNSSVHSSTKFAPNCVTKHNQMDVWFNSNADLLNRRKRYSKLKVNDFVRIKINKDLFTKGYAQTYTNELYKVTEVTNSNPITYKISDNTDQGVLGIFYESELSRVKL